MGNIDKRKKYFLVLDVETTGGLGNPLVYDLGFAICDKHGNTYAEKSFVIDEIFNNEPLMKEAYFAEKIPQYKEDIKNGKREMVTFLTARETLLNLMQEYEVSTIAAYNLAFDRRALKATTEYLYGIGKKFLPSLLRDVEQLCIWSFACEVIYTQPTFWKFAEKHQLFTECGNMRTSAEIGWRYITNDNEFEESHTGLEDVQIEIQIMAKCFRQCKRHESGILSNPWRIPNNVRNNS